MTGQIETESKSRIKARWWRSAKELCPDLVTGMGGDAEPGTIPPSIVNEAWAAALGIPFIRDLRDLKPLADYVERVPIGFSRRHSMIAFKGDEDGQPAMVVLGDVSRWQQVDVVRRFLRCDLVPALSTEDEVLAAINLAYQQRVTQSQSLVDGLENRQDVEILDVFDSVAGHKDLLDNATQPPVIKLVNTVLFEAIKARASDIHIQPFESKLVIRQRIDGVLFDALRVPKGFQDEIVSRMKVLGGMNIAEKRLPQDGRATVQIGDVTVDLRIASLPTSHGERVVVRFLDKGARLYTLDELGMGEAALGRFRSLIKLEHGLILVTGPTGSGKSTTLYAALQEIDSSDLNVLTLEDPIEYQLDGISQTQINPKKGLTFASGLRNVLRQDPDIIMVGEIRDHETAEMAIQSALTGHLVFSTLHTNDAASAVTRLLDLGIEPYLVASSLVAVVAQRLVRRICPDCRHPVTNEDSQMAQIGLDARAFEDDAFFFGIGCETCRNTGYRGRVGVFELLSIDENVGELIQAKANAAEIRAAGRKHGMRMLRDDGVAKAAEGLTTLDEVVRVAMRNADVL